MPGAAGKIAAANGMMIERSLLSTFLDSVYKAGRPEI
jgi:hypothetical protein